MQRSSLRNIYLKFKFLTDKKNCNIKRNFCRKLLKTIKKEYFNNFTDNIILLMLKVTDNVIFWRTAVLIFSSKNSKSDKIILNEEGKSVSDEKELCRTFGT